MHHPSAAIVAVGSELLSGQITNRNAAWISAELSALGIGVQRHLTVDDVENEIVWSLDAASRDTRHVFVTGGLGPTSDDLTRDAVAKWSGGRELVFHEPSWARIVAFFEKLGGGVPETNRQQCYFPRGARVLENTAGTANAFALDLDAVTLWVLPGPPREVEAVWRAHIEPSLRDAIPASERLVWKMWRTIGRGESHLAEVVEKVVLGVKASGVEVAYRAHPPYVETKLRFLESERDKLADVCARLEAALSPWLYEVDREDHVAAFVAMLAARPEAILIDDAFTRGQLAELLGPALRTARLATRVSLMTRGSPTSEEGAPRSAEVQSMIFAITPLPADDCAYRLTVRAGGRESSVDCPSSYASYQGDREALASRVEKATAFLAVRRWRELAEELA